MFVFTIKSILFFGFVNSILRLSNGEIATVKGKEKKAGHRSGLAE